MQVAPAVQDGAPPAPPTAPPPCPPSARPPEPAVPFPAAPPPPARPTPAAPPRRRRTAKHTTRDAHDGGRSEEPGERSMRGHATVIATRQCAHRGQNAIRKRQCVRQCRGVSGEDSLRL